MNDKDEGEDFNISFVILPSFTFTMGLYFIIANKIHWIGLFGLVIWFIYIPLKIHSWTQLYRPFPLVFWTAITFLPLSISLFFLFTGEFGLLDIPAIDRVLDVFLTNLQEADTPGTEFGQMYFFFVGFAYTTERMTYIAHQYIYYYKNQ